MQGAGLDDWREPGGCAAEGSGERTRPECWFWRPAETNFLGGELAGKHDKRLATLNKVR